MLLIIYIIMMVFFGILAVYINTKLKDGTKRSLNKKSELEVIRLVTIIIFVIFVLEIIAHMV